MQSGDGLTLHQMGGVRPGLPYLNRQKCVTSLSDVAANMRLGNSASLPRQTFPEALCAPAMTTATNIDKLSR